MKNITQLYMCNGDVGSSKFMFYVYDDESVSLHYISTSGKVTEIKNTYVKKTNNLFDICYGSNGKSKWLTDVNGKLLPSWTKIL
jgi:hypothetical protein